jgi:hypothetical protein
MGQLRLESRDITLLNINNVPSSGVEVTSASESARLCGGTAEPEMRDDLRVSAAGCRRRSARVRASYPGNCERLVAAKTKYDPMNVFRVNQNIKPAA